MFCCGNGAKKAESVENNKLDQLALSYTSLNSIEASGMDDDSNTDDELVLNVYPLQKSNKCYAKLNVSQKMLGLFAKVFEYVPIVVLLDQSGSMGSYFNLLLTNVIPNMLLNTGYKKSDRIELICFESSAHHSTPSIEEMMKMYSRCLGGTNFAPAIKSLQNLFASKDFTRVRIITVSDGEIMDEKLSSAAASELVTFLRNKHIAINSAAVRYMTSSYGSPDTTALCSLLQLSTVGPTAMLEISASNYENQQASVMKTAFLDDGLDCECKIVSSTPILKSKPWEIERRSEIALRAGQNEFWVCDPESLAQVQLQIGNSPVKVVMHESIKTLEEASIVMRKTIAETTDRLKVLKIVDSPDAIEQIRLIIRYFEQIDRNLTEVELKATNDPALSSRVAYLKQALAIRSRGFYNKMAQIANDDSVGQLNAAQKAEYLRNTDASKTSRGLAKRALKSGFNFDEIARTEAQAIAENLHELAVLPEETNSSFYSLETTMGGLKYLKELVVADKNGELTATEILQFVNIVGMAAKGPVGDFPDPMTYRVEQIYPNCFVSISDLLTAQLQGGKLTVPGFEDAEITNVIPVFEDFRLAKFLKKHAPTLLSYSASIGMRGMIADVSMTDGYTLCSGIWKLVEEIAKNSSELKLRTFKSLCDSYDLFVGGYFAHIDELLVPKKKADDFQSMYLLNNGTTNLIGPLYRAFKKSPSKIKQLMPRILRALFSYEIWQALRRLFKASKKAPQIITECLNRLLGVDFEKYGMKPTALFQEEVKKPTFHSEYHVDWDYLEGELISKLAWYVKYVALLPLLLEAAADGSIMKFVVPELDDSFLAAQLDVPDMKQFLFLTAAQAFYYPFASNRCSKDAKVMLMSDLKWPNEFEEALQTHCAKTYRANYDTLLNAKMKEELEQLKIELLDRIFAATEVSEVVQLLRNGLTRGPRVLKIGTTMSLGYIDFRDALIAGRPSPISAHLIRLFLLTRANPGSEPAYNGGKVVWVNDFEAFERAFIKAGGSESEWSEIKKTYQTEAMHTYRMSGKPNRHTHHNGKVSYWAIGYSTLEDMRQKIPEQDFLEYCRVHYECCGVRQLDLDTRMQ